MAANISKTVPFAIFMIICAFFTQALADNDLYTVENVIVDKTAQNAVIARDEAIVAGQRQAFEILTRRLIMDDEDIEKMSDISDLEISSIINDFETGQEKFSGKRYRAVMTVRFNSSAVKNYLNRQGNRSLVKSRGKPILILPYISEPEATYLWSRNNPWLKEWQSAESVSGLVPVIVPKGDIEDATVADEAQILMSGQREISELLNRYQTDKILLPVAEKKENGADITIYEYIGSELSPVKTITIEQEGEALLWTEAVRSVRNYINKDWKNRLKYSESAMDDRVIDVNVKFSSMRDWLQIQKKLLAQPEIENIQTKTFNRTQALISVNLNASADELVSSLVNKNLILTKVRGRTGFGTEVTPPLFELSENTSTYTYPSYETLPVPQYTEDNAVVAPPSERLQDQPSLMNQNTDARGSYEYKYRSQNRNNKEWDNSYDRP